MIETEYYTLISDYFCTDCDLSGDFKTVIQHRIQFHEHEKLIVHRKILHEVSGKKVRQAAKKPGPPYGLYNKPGPPSATVKIKHAVPLRMMV